MEVEWKFLMKVEFSWLKIFKIFQIWTKNARLEQLSFHPSFVTITKPLSNKILEACRERLKLMSKHLEIDGRKDF